MNLNDADTHFKIIFFLKEFYSKGWPDEKVKVLTKYFKQYDIHKLKRAIVKIIENESMLPENPIPLIKDQFVEKLTLRDVEVIMNRIEKEILFTGIYKTPKNLNDVDRGLICEFGGWPRVCNNFDNFKWFLINSIKSGNVSCEINENLLKGIHDRKLKSANNKIGEILRKKLKE